MLDKDAWSGNNFTTTRKAKTNYTSVGGCSPTISTPYPQLWTLKPEPWALNPDSGTLDAEP